MSAPRVFRSDAHEGFLGAIANDPRSVAVSKREHLVQVRFAPQDCAVATAEGVVHARAGDAIVTGGAGEQWPVPPERFGRKYEAVAPTRPGGDGTYRSLALPLLALRMDAPFTVVLADGRSQLQGRSGDWLVDHGDGGLGVVAQQIFRTTYERMDRNPISLHQVIQRVLLAGERFGPEPVPRPMKPPRQLAVLVERVGAAHREYNRRAIENGNRYRSAFWSIYLLGATAVLTGVLPPALGWDDSRHAMHSYAGLWAVLEVVIIGAVAVVYVRGHRRDWQGLWMAARTQAELAWYLPLLAPLVDFGPGAEAGNWYARVFPEVPGLRSLEGIDELCAKCEAPARESLARAWDDPAFIPAYVDWTLGILERQRHYHSRVACRQRALWHRVHRINTVLFALTAAGALAHLWLHSLWLSLATIFFPALGTSLHGALAQTESYRLAASSDRLAAELARAADAIEQAVSPAAPAQGAAAAQGRVRAAVGDAIMLILEEHEDWHMLVQPHHLPLA